MVADVVWSNLTVAGAFTLGAVLATVAVLRVVRAVSTMFGLDPVPRRRAVARRRHDDDEPPAAVG